MKLNIHLSGFAMRKDLLIQRQSVKFYFARDIGEKCAMIKITL